MDFVHLVIFICAISNPNQCIASSYDKLYTSKEECGKGAYRALSDPNLMYQVASKFGPDFMNTTKVGVGCLNPEQLSKMEQLMNEDPNTEKLFENRKRGF